MKYSTLLSLASIFTYTLAHGDHGSPGSDSTNLKESPPDGLTWEEWHMKQEHGLDEYDAESFFTLHDSKNKNYLDADDILNAYGLNRDEVVGKGDGLGSHDDSEGISKETKDQIVKAILKMMDANTDDKITKEEYLKFANKGGKFPDLGVGVGHHGDFEYEYEVHHWNKYHKDQDPDIKNIHKEDIEHELLHHEHEIEHEVDTSVGKWTDEQFEQYIKLQNIPKKFRS
ncbi:putative secreted protein [Wickerhamomyces ciferrii]|uniref:Secreted protein n=1 Tax=Wickerhamomyces ciferrii (strain ATCC 14091 / BCRC 22168 / CBS 111 / JCM 3599 / NBRC 0793 / NRRL Y-1031 F-60-10) TaxID=1206466 RepID=K0KX09_WICCF|nr:uncharacterized protein BN7_6180 [Wickerhamomyces ciferrii]CCH46587.1 putative secreted protein [Wickerhamomyces ciferrii]